MGAAYRTDVPGQVNNDLDHASEVWPPRDGVRVWRVVDGPVHDGDRFLPHGGNVSAPGLDERSDARRRRMRVRMAHALEPEAPLHAVAQVAADLAKPAKLTVKSRAGARVMTNPRAWDAKPAPKLAALAVDAGESGAVDLAADMRARLIARMERYQRAHGRPMPRPIVLDLARSMGLAS